MNESNLVIIGGGPAGLFAAWSAARTLHLREKRGSVTLLERNPQCGRKLLVTGSGQCNLTRDDEANAMLDHYGEHGRFLVHALHTLDPHKTMHLFEQQGLPLIVREDRKVFPASLRAADVLQTLLKMCSTAGVRIISGTRITRVEHEEGRFVLFSDAGEATQADSMAITTGGAYFPKTGSTGDGYTLVSQLGHMVVPPRPALCPFKAIDSGIGSCSGITVDPVVLTSMSNGKRRSSTGALLITHEGLSGPAVMNHSRYLDVRDTVSICWLPRMNGEASSAQEVEAKLKGAIAGHGAAKLETIVHELGLPSNLVSFLLLEATIDGKRKAAETGRKTIAALSSLLTAYPMKVSTIAREHLAKATAGGVSLDQVDPRSMESRLVPKLFFAGEVLDIDGDTGGYNLQAAWSTGAFAGIGLAGGNPFTTVNQLCTLE